jgi:osmotically-inducible protein OsmY
MPYIKKMLAVVVAGACVSLAGCDNTAQGVKQDAQENKAAAEQGAAEAKADSADERAEIKQEGREAGAAIGEAASDAGRAIGNAAEKAGDKIAGAANDAAPTVDAAKQTLDVKTALMADSSIDATRIDVDTSASTRTVTLKGSVATAAQKSAAERIAKSKAGGYTVKNMLTVSR